MANKIDEELTTISLKKGTRERLESFGKKAETYDELINRILNEKEGADDDPNKNKSE